MAQRLAGTLIAAYRGCVGHARSFDAPHLILRSREDEQNGLCRSDMRCGETMPSLAGPALSEAIRPPAIVPLVFNLVLNALGGLANSACMGHTLSWSLYPSGGHEMRIRQADARIQG